ncbi:MAG: hypothetical protein ABFQ95_02970 [Pseudomonadota bacterium]
MDGFDEREKISDVIEVALSNYDYGIEEQLNDNDAIQIIEMLLDVYYFAEDPPKNDNPLVENGFQVVLSSIQKKLLPMDLGELSKILGAIRFVAKRRTTGRREYMEIIRQYVGVDLKGLGRVKIIVEPGLG